MFSKMSKQRSLAYLGRIISDQFFNCKRKLFKNAYLTYVLITFYHAVADFILFLFAQHFLIYKLQFATGIKGDCASKGRTHNVLIPKQTCLGLGQTQHDSELTPDQ